MSHRARDTVPFHLNTVWIVLISLRLPPIPRQQFITRISCRQSGDDACGICERDPGKRFADSVVVCENLDLVNGVRSVGIWSFTPISNQSDTFGKRYRRCIGKTCGIRLARIVTVSISFRDSLTGRSV